MNTKYFQIAICSLFVFMGLSILRTQENGRKISVDALVKEALDRNPQIKSAERRWQAALHKP
ncbi:MAG: hypothetical protein ACE5HS_07730, partial [bacterium]